MILTENAAKNADELVCSNCGAQHLLLILWKHSEVSLYYDRFTGRYPLEHYDNPFDLPIVRLHTEDDNSEGERSSGPIIVSKRKRNFSKAEIKKIWEKTKGKCHLCGKSWLITERSRDGWHIDHKIPHIAGGDVEDLANLFVSCAKCNLNKGGRTKPEIIRAALETQILDKLVFTSNK